MIVTAWVTSRTGKFVNFPTSMDPAQSHQCVALFYDFNQYVNVGESYPGASGSGLWNIAFRSYAKIPAIASQQYGDWASWSGTTGAYPNGGAGHTAMWAAPYNATSGYFFTQNPGVASIVLLQYAGIQGYLRMESTPMSLNVLDVSRYQGGDSLAGTGADACIVAATFGTSGVNPYLADEVSRARAAGLLLGLYHIRAGDGPTPQAEGDAFIAAAKPYLDGKTVLVLDWEECTLSDVPWAVQFCTYVQAQTGVLPIIYMSASVSNAYDWSTLRAINVGLWVAQYPYSTCNGFVGVNWTPPATSWPVLVGWQYCSGGTVGSLTGVDLSIFYITAAQWLAYAAPNNTEENMPLTAADVALIWAYKNTGSGDTIDMHQALNNACNSAATASTQATVAAAGVFTPANIWAYKNTASGDAVDMHQAVMNASAGAATATAINTAVAALKTAVAGVPAAVLNQTFTTAAGATTNVPGILDAINTKPVVTLTTDQTNAIAASIASVLESSLPTSTLTALKAQLNK